MSEYAVGFGFDMESELYINLQKSEIKKGKKTVDDCCFMEILVLINYTLSYVTQK